MRNELCKKNNNMKKVLYIAGLLLAATMAKAQVIIDTVSLGAGYANQVWYSLANDNQGASLKANWDLAFDVSGQGSSIHINSITGTTLWQYPSTDTTGWSTLDTAGINTWSKRWNSDTSWAMGAMGRYANPNNSLDLDWGIYSTVTHVVTGDSLYVIKLANGSYKKLHIRSLSGGAYNFRYADLSGSNLQNATLVKSNYTGQNFGYYSLQSNAALSREPAGANWDLLFTQYTTFIPSPYTVTGILQNKGVKVAEVKSIANASAYTNWTNHALKTAINIIGYDWKTYVSSYVIEDSLVYFVQSKAGEIWKVIPTGFGGSANGNNIFSKEKLSAVGISENNSKIATVALYPNPSNGANVTVIISVNDISSQSSVKIFDLNGKLVKEQNAIELASNKLNTVELNTSELCNGVYVVTVTVGENSVNQKLIINK